MFIKAAIDEIIEESQSNWIDYFDQEGNVYGSPRGVDKKSLPSYLDYYHAIGYFLGKDVQDKYKRKVRFCAGLLVLQRPSAMLGMLLLTVGIILAMFGQKPDSFPSAAVLLVVFPLFGFVIHLLFIESGITTYLGNAYHAERGKSASAVISRVPKRRRPWPIIGLSLLFLATGFLQSWSEAFGFILFFSSTLVFSCLEGFFLWCLIKIWFAIFPKKQKETFKTSLSPQLLWQIRERCGVIYRGFQSENYAAAFAEFDSSRLSEEEFQQVIQDFLAKKGLKRFYLPEYQLVQDRITFSQITDQECKAVLSLFGSSEAGDTLFRLDCHLTFEEDKLQSLELIELSR